MTKCAQPEPFGVSRGSGGFNWTSIGPAPCLPKDDSPRCGKFPRCDGPGSRAVKAPRAISEPAREARHYRSMTLPLNPPLPPMEALSVDEIPRGEQWEYEPKWDGFRCLVFRDGDKIELQSKSGRSMTRYFPELVAAVGELAAEKFVLDGEIVVPANGGFSFDDLLQRIHPAPSRVRRLAAETPALLILFDLLVDDGGHAIMDQPLKRRRAELKRFFAKYCRGATRLRLSPATAELSEAKAWLK